jgi:hypothetical protein
MAMLPALDLDVPPRLCGVLRPAGHVVAASRGEDTVLLDLVRGRYYTLDAVGGRIWALLHGGRRAADIVAQLIAEYDAPASVIATDAVAFLEALRRARLLMRER